MKSRLATIICTAAAIMATTPKMQSQAAGKMGHSTTQVGDLVADVISKAK